MGASVSVLPDNVDEHEGHEKLLDKFEAIKLHDNEGKLPEKLPGTLKECLDYEVDADDEVSANAYKELQRVFEDWVIENATPVVETSVRGLAEALDTAIYQHERWPVMIDPSGQGTRFLKYQRGTFLMAQSPMDMQPEHLRKAVVGSLSYGTAIMLDFEKMEHIDLDSHFDEDHFPKEILKKTDLFKEEVYSKLLRPAEGDPQPDTFRPKDEFTFIIASKNEEGARKFAQQHGFAIVTVLDPSSGNGKKTNSKSSKDPGADEIAAAFGVRDVKRNSNKLLEAAFDGEWDVVQDEIDKGYSIESEDAHQHTPLSEAACQGHLEICQKLLDLGAEPNARNDAGRTPLYRAAYNGHIETVQLLLKNGGDPRLTAGLESPFDVAKTDEVRQILEEWDVAETDRLIKKRKEEEYKRQEELLSTAAERDAFAREKIRQELIQLTLDGKKDELRDRLEELANEAVQHDERPRGSAEVRDDRGNTLLLLAVWKNHVEIVEMLLTHFETLDPDFDKIERKVFFSNIKAREAKGWNACALATFHGHKKLLQFLLEKGADPYVKNSYGKSSFDFAQDDLDACKKVLVDRSEIRSVLMEWEKLQNPRGAAKREEEEAAATAGEGNLEEGKANKEETTKKKKQGGGKTTGKKGGAATKKKGKKKT